MRITATEEYGLRCILQLARQGDGGSLSATQIASREGISPEYASKLMNLFRKAGLVDSERGLKGGFRLARSPKNSSLLDVFQALGKPSKAGSFCDKFSGDRAECVHVKDCSVRPVWQTLLSLFDSILAELSLADLVGDEAKTRGIVEARSVLMRQEFLKAVTNEQSA
jgi:Rrf2 family iron-sulfur cluster assembly transcriptional regulator